MKGYVTGVCNRVCRNLHRATVQRGVRNTLCNAAVGSQEGTGKMSDGAYVPALPSQAAMRARRVCNKVCNAGVPRHNAGGYITGVCNRVCNAGSTLWWGNASVTLGGVLADTPIYHI